MADFAQNWYGIQIKNNVIKVFKHLIIGDSIFILISVAGNTISEKSYDSGVAAYLFILLAIFFLCYYTSVKIFIEIESKLNRILIGFILYCILLYLFFSDSIPQFKNDILAYFVIFFAQNALFFTTKKGIEYIKAV